jgi:plastocyanin
MRRPLVVLTIALAALLSACTSSSAPGWTYAPPTQAPASPPAPSGDASAAPSSQAPSSQTPSSAAPSDSGGTGGDVVELSAMMIQYEQTELKAPADKDFALRFDNKDAGTPHNVEIKDANGQSVFKGEIFNGAAVKDYAVPALAAGTYQFVCSVHPNMVGTLTVGG